MRFKGYLVKLSFLWVEGLAFFPFIFLRSKRISDNLLNHERIHLIQQLELGVLPFYLWYFTEYVIRLIQFQKHYLAYMNISFEQEAYLNEDNEEYIKLRKPWSFLKYMKNPTPKK